MLSVEVIGYLAGFIVAVSLTPQVLKAWKTKSTKDISLAWNAVYLAGLSLWVVYGFGIGSWPIIVAITIEAALALSLLVLKLRHG